MLESRASDGWIFSMLSGIKIFVLKVEKRIIKRDKTRQGYSMIAYLSLAKRLRKKIMLFSKLLPDTL